MPKLRLLITLNWSLKIQKEFHHTYISDQNKEIKDILRIAYNDNVGLEYNCTTAWHKIELVEFINNHHLKPMTLNLIKIFNGGIGFNFANGNIGIDLAYAYGWWKDIGDNYDARMYQEHFRILNNITVMLPQLSDSNYILID